MSDAGEGGREQQHGGGSPPPGWYDDPSGQHEARWWDGCAWTDHVQGGTTPPSQAPAQPDTVGMEGSGSGSGSGSGGNRLALVAVAALVVIVGGAGLALLAGGGAGPSAGTCATLDLAGPVSDTYLGNLKAGQLQEVNCSNPHNIEVLHTISSSEARQHGIGSISAAERFCADNYFESYVGVRWEDSELDLEAAWLGPDDEVFEDEEPVVCLLIDGDPFTSTVGSLRGSDR